MVGDRLNTDIAFGQAGGLATLLVLTGEPLPFRYVYVLTANAGITQEAEVYGPEGERDPVVPDYVTDALGDLRAAL
jgi:4-nitrophenyl phosphatase